MLSNHNHTIPHMLARIALAGASRELTVRTRLIAVLSIVLSVGWVSPAKVGAAAPPPAKPNVILWLTDDQTMESVAKMPYLSSQLGRMVSFRSAFVENGLCCPSRATILSGQYDTHTGVTNNAQGQRFDRTKNLGMWLQAAGYRTGLFGKLLNAYPYGKPPLPWPGWNDWQVTIGVQAYKQYNYLLTNNGKVEKYGARPADYQVDVLTAKAASFAVGSAQAGKPFFGYLAPTATHMPWRASPSRTGMFAKTPVPHSPDFNQPVYPGMPKYLARRAPISPSLADNLRRREWAAAVSVDDAVQRLDRALQSVRYSDGSTAYDRTVLVFMTDNGYAFGEHRWFTKRCEYDECVRTPLLVRYPGVPGGVDATHLITNTDIAPTLLEIAGGRSTRTPDGRSFLPLVKRQPVTGWRGSLLLHWSGGDPRGRPTARDAVPAFWGVRTTAYKYVELATGERELYDLRIDPYEMRNRYGDPAYGRVQAALQAELAALKRSAGAPGPLAPAPTGTLPPFNPATYVDLD